MILNWKVLHWQAALIDAFVLQVRASHSNMHCMMPSIIHLHDKTGKSLSAEPHVSSYCITKPTLQGIIMATSVPHPVRHRGGKPAKLQEQYFRKRFGYQTAACCTFSGCRSPCLGALGRLKGASLARPATAWGIPSARSRALLRAILW